MRSRGGPGAKWGSNRFNCSICVAKSIAGCRGFGGEGVVEVLRTPFMTAAPPRPIVPRMGSPGAWGTAVSSSSPGASELATHSAEPPASARERDCVPSPKSVAIKESAGSVCAVPGGTTMVSMSRAPPAMKPAPVAPVAGAGAGAGAAAAAAAASVLAFLATAALALRLVACSERFSRRAVCSVSDLNGTPGPPFSRSRWQELL